MAHAFAQARGRMVAACELDAPPAGFARAAALVTRSAGELLASYPLDG